MKLHNLLAIAVMIFWVFVCAGISAAAGKEEAKSLVKQAAAYVKYQGKGKALAEISKERLCLAHQLNKIPCWIGEFHEYS